MPLLLNLVLAEGVEPSLHGYRPWFLPLEDASKLRAVQQLGLSANLLHGAGFAFDCSEQSTRTSPGLFGEPTQLPGLHFLPSEPPAVACQAICPTRRVVER